MNILFLEYQMAYLFYSLRFGTVDSKMTLLYHLLTLRNITNKKMLLFL